MGIQIRRDLKDEYFLRQMVVTLILTAFFGILVSYCFLGDPELQIMDKLLYGFVGASVFCLISFIVSFTVYDMWYEVGDKDKYPISKRRSFPEL